MTVKDAALALTLPAFLAWMTRRRMAMIEAAKVEHAAAPQFGVAAYPALRWPEVPEAAWEAADTRAWEWHRR